MLNTRVDPIFASQPLKMQRWGRHGKQQMMQPGAWRIVRAACRIVWDCFDTMHEPRLAFALTCLIGYTSGVVGFLTHSRIPVDLVVYPSMVWLSRPAQVAPPVLGHRQAAVEYRRTKAQFVVCVVVDIFTSARSAGGGGLRTDCRKPLVLAGVVHV
jgi:hypothetical protein